MLAADSSNCANQCFKIFAFFLILGSLSACGGSSSSPNNTSSSLSEKVNNGLVVNETEFPFVRRLVARNPKTGAPGQLCSAAFITPHHLLTAAHCLYTLSEAAEGYELSIQDLDGSFVAVTGLSVYPYYEPGVVKPSRVYADVPVFPFDIAVVAIDGTYTGPVAAISRTIPSDGQPFFFFGFGSYDGTHQDGALRYGENSIAGVSEHEMTFYSVFDAQGNSSICSGDSGGPVFASFGGQSLIIGINDGVTENCQIGSVNAFTLVPHPLYVSWLQEVTSGSVQVY